MRVFLIFLLNKIIKMKKQILLLSFVVAIGFSSFAQVINLGFENWTPGGNPPFDEPDGWATFNSTLYPLGVTNYTASKGTPAQNGSYALRLETKVLGAPVNDTVTAFAVCGTMSIIPFPFAIKLKGKALNQRPMSVSGFYKYSTPGVTDSAAMGVFVTKWNGTSTDTLGIGYGKGAPIGAYTPFTFNMFYDPQFNGVTPDSILILILSSANDVYRTVGSVLYIDNLTLNGVDFSTVQLLSSNPTESYSVYPNPANEVFTISAAKIGMNRDFILYDAIGREVMNLKIEEMSTSIPITKLPEGLYHYKIVSTGNEIIHSGKIDILR